MVYYVYGRELYVWLEMAPSSGTDFRKVDAGYARYTIASGDVSCIMLFTRTLFFLYNYRRGFVVIEASGVPWGNFIVSALTLSQLPPKHVPFLVTLYSDNVFNFEPC